MSHGQSYRLWSELIMKIIKIIEIIMKNQRPEQHRFGLRLNLVVSGHNRREQSWQETRCVQKVISRMHVYMETSAGVMQPFLCPFSLACL